MLVKKWGAGLLAFLLLFSVFIPNSFAAETTEPIMQVKLVNYLGNQSQVTIQLSGDYLVDQSNIKLTSGKSYLVKYENNKISLMDGTTKITTADTLRLVPSADNNSLSINGRPYLGTMRFIPENSKYVRPINEVYMEDYLKGVVPFESYESWNIEALKAQAVASRTYALGLQSKVIDDTISYQVYGGYKWSSYPKSIQAVDETKGEVLKSGTSLISAVFSASNGGRTESNANVWGGTPLSYLPIKDDPFDAKTAWSFTVKKQQINPANKTWTQMSEADTAITNNMKTWMASHGYAGKDIKITGIPVLSLYAPKSGGRVSLGDITIEFFTKDQIDSNGAYIPQRVEYKQVSATQIRSMVGIGKMLSYLVTNSTVTNDSITISGLGNGHGVGLSQWGAENRAQAGQKYNEILAFYYQGATLIKQYTARPVIVTQVPDEQITTDTTAKDVQENIPVVTADTIAPKISNPSVQVDNTKHTAGIQFTINEPAKVTIYLKDKNGTILSYLVKDMMANAGTITKQLDTSKLADGTYYAGIITVDNSKNQSSVLPSFTVKKPVPPKDKTAPKISSVKVSVDNTKNKATLSFNTNELSKVTVYVKDSKGKILSYLKKDSSNKAGTISQVYSTSALANGRYTFGIITIDPSNNRSSAAVNFDVKKAPKVKTGKVTATKLSVRSSASTKGKIVGTLKKNQVVTILSTSGSWDKIKYGKITGYVSKSYIK